MKPRLVLVVLVLAFAALACNMPSTQSAALTGTGTPTGPVDFLTQVAQTLDARQTQTGMPPAAATTSVPQTATNAPTRTNTPVPPTDTPEPCDQASFISDVTIPDGTKVAPGQAFTKTWRLKNIGTCTWSTSYAIVFAGGDSMGAPAVINLPGSVEPNQTIDISVDMKAPNTAGKYTGNWKLRNSTGGVFSPGGNAPFYVQIQVASITPTVTITPTITATAKPGTTVFSFTSDLCAAEWRSKPGVIACPATAGDAAGYMQLLNNPTLENGTNQSSPVLLTVPDTDPSGAITGRYPALTIQQGTRLRASLGCLNGATACKVIYQINYALPGGAPVNLGQWNHKYGDGLINVDIDLSSLAGQQVQIILAVLNDGKTEGDQAVWVNPRIVKP